MAARGRPDASGTSRRIALLLLGAAILAGCDANEPEPTPYPTPEPRAEAGEAPAVAEAFVAAWADAEYGALYRMLAASDRERYSRAEVEDLLAAFDELAGVARMRGTLGEPERIVLPPQPRPPPGPARAPAPRRRS